jgi:hypothetical protein
VPLKEILLGIKCVIPRPPRFLRGPYPSHKVRPLCVGVYLFVPPGFFTPHSPDLSLGGAPRGNGLGSSMASEFWWGYPRGQEALTGDQGRQQSQALVAHSYDPSYSGGTDEEDHSSKPAPDK